MSSSVLKLLIAVAFVAVVGIHAVAPKIGVSGPEPQPNFGGARLIPPPPGMAR